MRQKSPLSPSEIKRRRDQLHTSKSLTDKQADRMKRGHKETQPDEFPRVSPMDRARRVVRKAIEDLQDARELQRMIGDAW